jgi:hypothetical protein
MVFVESDHKKRWYHCDLLLSKSKILLILQNTTPEIMIMIKYAWKFFFCYFIDNSTSSRLSLIHRGFTSEARSVCNRSGTEFWRVCWWRRGLDYNHTLHESSYKTCWCHTRQKVNWIRILINKKAFASLGW